MVELAHRDLVSTNKLHLIICVRLKLDLNITVILDLQNSSAYNFYVSP